MRSVQQLPRFRQAREELSQLATREQWTRAEIEAYQLDRLNTLWGHAIAEVPYYRDLAHSLALPAGFDSLAEYTSRVPLLTKETVRRSAHDLVSARTARGRWFSTGGSTGTFTRIWWAHDDHRRALRAKYRLYQMWGVDFFARTVFLWGGDHRHIGGLRGRIQRTRELMLDRLRGRKRLSAYNTGAEAARGYLQQIHSFRPAMLYGYSQAVHLLAREALRLGFRCESIQLVVLTSEVATDEIVVTVERAFGAPVIAEYGATECPLIAGQATDGTWRVREDQVLAETVPAAHGRYQIVITVLENQSFPMLRYAIEDMVDRPLHRPPAGFAVIAPVSGRHDDIVVSGEGMWIHGTVFDALFKTTAEVQRYRVHQAADGSVRALIELDAPLSPERQHALNAALAAAVPGRATTLDVVPQIPLTRGGKLRVVSSDLFSRGLD
jgi:phenylacetate-CoA ligase